VHSNRFPGIAWPALCRSGWEQLSDAVSHCHDICFVTLLPANVKDTDWDLLLDLYLALPLQSDRVPQIFAPLRPSSAQIFLEQGQKNMMQWTCLQGNDMLEMSFQQVPSVTLHIHLQLAKPGNGLANGLSNELVCQMKWFASCCVCCRGVKVVQLPFRNEGTQWAELQGDMDRQIQYLSAVLSANDVNILDMSRV
jgi:hypothetical protein